jgi:hypothetical protein
VNADKTKYMVMSRDQNSISHNLKVDDISFESLKEFRLFGTVLKYQNSAQ